MDLLEVLDGGILTTVQDLGRTGYQRYGVPQSGALDSYALRVGNILVGNPDGAAGLEMTLAGPRLRILADTVLAVTGADLQPRINDAPFPTWHATPAPAGSVLSFGDMARGMRAYLAVAGGIDVPPVMGSRATYVRARLGGLEGRSLRPGDLLPAAWEGPLDRVDGRRLPDEGVPVPQMPFPVLRVVLGPHTDAFSPDGVRTFLDAAYTISPQSDRTGYRLQGPAVEHSGRADIVSEGVPLGAIQVAGDGMPMVLLADRGTTGGYTKLATVISVDLPLLAQATPGDVVTFQSVSLEEAHALLRRQEEFLDNVRQSPPTVFARRSFRVLVNGVEREVETSLVELDPRSPRRAPHRTLQVALGGIAHSVGVEEVPRSRRGPAA